MPRSCVSSTAWTFHAIVGAALRMRAVPMRRHCLPRNVSMASRGVPHRAVSASLRTEGERSRGSENMLRYGTSGCPVRALRSAAGRRLHLKSTRVLTFEVFLILVYIWRAALTALSILLAGTGGARASHEPTDANRRDGSAGRTGPGISPGRLFPNFAFIYARRASSTPPGETLT